jgi:transcriptional regulator with XRE-family HTH domain
MEGRISVTRAPARKERNAMYGNPQRRRTDEVVKLRKEAGRWLKRLREDRGLSQTQLAALLGNDHYTFISQVEAGRGRIPPDRYVDWANALGVSAYDFSKELLRYYNPPLHGVLFGEQTDGEDEEDDRPRRERDTGAGATG